MMQEKVSKICFFLCKKVLKFLCVNCQKTFFPLGIELAMAEICQALAWF